MTKHTQHTPLPPFTKKSPSLTNVDLGAHAITALEGINTQLEAIAEELTQHNHFFKQLVDEVVEIRLSQDKP